MAARLWRWVVGLALGLAAACAGFLSRARSLPWTAAPAIAVALLLAAVAAVIALSFVIARIAPNPGLERSSPVDVWRALLREIADFPLIVLAMCADTHAGRMQSPPARHRARPVLLLHGIVCNAQVWRALRRRLRTAGFGPVEALDIEPLLVDIDVQVRRVTPELLALQRRSDGERVLIIAHSMGGLIARALLRDLGPAAIRRIVTIAAPHHGTRLVRGLPWQDTRQMRRNSAWLRALNATQEGCFSVPLVSIYSVDDNLVAPADSARLDGAENHEVRGVGHLGMLRSPRALDCVMAALSPAYPNDCQ
jgi:pimeloyl-ACP methyl ester carboxylesterase